MSPGSDPEKKECFDLIITNSLSLSLGNLSWLSTFYHSQRFSYYQILIFTVTSSSSFPFESHLLKVGKKKLMLVFKRNGIKLDFL